MKPRSLTPLCADAALVEPLDGLVERRLRERERDVVHAARIGRRARGSGVALLVREDGDQPAVARIEVEVALARVVEVRLLEHERHAEHALPEVDRRLPVGADDRDVVHALALELPHQRSPLGSCSTSFDLYSLRPQAAPRHELDRASGRRARRAAARGSPRRARRRRGASRASSTATGSGGSCFTPRRLRPDEDVAADRGREPAHDLAHGRREDVDAAHDQHVVGAPDAAHARAGAAARAGRRAHLDVVARAEPQQRRGPVPEVREHELARRRRRSSAIAAPVSGSISSAWTKPRAPRCMPSCSSHSPQSDGADVADAHRLGHARAPALLELRPERRLAAAGLAGDEHALDARRRRGRSRARRPTRSGTRRTTASAPPPRARSSSIACISRSVLPVPTGM